MIEVRISSGTSHFDELRRRFACLTSESEIEGTFKKTKKIKRALCGGAEEGELKMEER
jgi:hypothetical protein